jgi:uncharacterized membrane protein
MDPVLQVALLFALFAATHAGLAWPPLRERLVARLGRGGFTALFSLVAWTTIGAAITAYAAQAGEGPAGLALGRQPAWRIPLVAAVAAGTMLMTGAFARYARSPVALRGARVREPRGLERVTRHPFFFGLALLGGAHALLATRLVGAVAMGSLGLFALVGAWLQDRKLLALRGEPYAHYRAVTSTVPFAAIAAGRQRLVVAELPLGLLALGLGLAWALRAVHGSLFDHGGLYVVAALVVGPLLILLDERRVARRLEASGAAG